MDSSFGTRITKDNNFDDKIREIQKKIAEEPKNRFLYKDYCKQLLKKPSQTNVIVALESIEKFLEFKPDNLEANILKARVLRLLLRNDDALSLLEILKHKEKDNQPDIEEEIGRNWLYQNKITNAKKILKDAYKKFPENNRIGRALVLCYEQTGETEIALHHTNLLIEKNPEDEKSIGNKIGQLRRLDRWKEAIEAGEECMARYPEIFFDIGFSNENQIVGVFLTHARTHFLYGVKIDNKNNHNQILLRNKEKIITTINISNEAKLHFKKCIQICDEFIYRITEYSQNINEKNLTSINELKVKCYSKIREFDKSILLCNEILIHKKTIPILYAKGFALMHLQRYKEALEIFEMTLKDYPRMKNADINKLIAIKKLYSKSEFEKEYQKFQIKYSEKLDDEKSDSITLKSKEEPIMVASLEQHSFFYINILENKLRDFVFSIYGNDEKRIKNNFKTIYESIKTQEDKDSKLLYQYPNDNPMMLTTLGGLYEILNNKMTKKILKELDRAKKLNDFLEHLSMVIKYRNPQGHTKGLNWEMGDLPDNEKMILIGSCTTLINTLDRNPEYGIINSTN
jgi:tetratricopeptide (TPR) repeat protein